MKRNHVEGNHLMIRIQCPECHFNCHPSRKGLLVTHFATHGITNTDSVIVPKVSLMSEEELDAALAQHSDTLPSRGHHLSGEKIESSNDSENVDKG